MDGQGIVYYIRCGGRIKIGYTGRFPTRMRTLAPDELLAVEPGHRRLEAARHQQFVEFRVHGREWFAPVPELMKHITSLAAIHGVPDLPPMPVPRWRAHEFEGWGGIPGKYLA